MTSPLNQVRVGKYIYSWNSTEFRFDNLIVEGIVAVDYEEKVEIDIVPGSQQDAPPLGWSEGKYTISGFVIKMLRDYADQLTTHLASKAPDGQSYGRATFDVMAQVNDKAFTSPLTITGTPCRIIGKKDAYEEGFDELLVEFEIACLQMSEARGDVKKRLWSGSDSLFPTTDTIKIGGETAPGKWVLVDAPKVYGWDIRNGYALSGGVVVPTGDELVVARFDVTLWDGSQYQNFCTFRAKYLRKALFNFPGSESGYAMGVDHPELTRLGAMSFVTKGLTPLVNNGKGLWTCSVTFLQYRKPQAAQGKPPAAIPSVSAPTPTAQDAGQREIQANQARIAGMAGQP